MQTNDKSALRTHYIDPYGTLLVLKVYLPANFQRKYFILLHSSG